MSSSTADPRLDAVEDELYGVAPEEFVRRRSEAVRSAKQRGDQDLAAAIGALRKPSAAAAALDAFARAEGAHIDTLLTVGDRLRDAVERGVGDEIRDVMRERARTMSEVMSAVREHAARRGGSLSSSVAEQVERTLRAAMASEEHARSLRRGVLATALDEPGLDAVGAPVTSRSGTDRPTTDPPAPRVDRRRRQALEQRMADAGAAVANAEEELAEASDRKDALASEQQEVRRRLDELERQLRSAREQEAEAEGRLRDARSEHRAARSALAREQDDAPTD